MINVFLLFFKTAFIRLHCNYDILFVIAINAFVEDFQTAMKRLRMINNNIIT